MEVIKDVYDKVQMSTGDSLISIIILIVAIILVFVIVKAIIKKTIGIAIVLAVVCTFLFYTSISAFITQANPILEFIRDTFGKIF